MATHATSTTAPALQPRLLRPFTFRPAPPVDDPRSVDELIKEIRRTIERQVKLGQVAPVSELPPAPLAAHGNTTSQPRGLSDLVPKEALASTAAKPLLPPVDHARALHMRRELHQALDHGFALLDVIDDAIATMDALDAPDEDREDDDPVEGTSLERFGRGFVRCGADDAEEDDEPERDDEPGSDDGEDIGHHASHYAPRPLTRAARADVAVFAARAAAMRGATHV